MPSQLFALTAALLASFTAIAAPTISYPAISTFDGSFTVARFCEAGYTCLYADLLVGESKTISRVVIDTVFMDVWVTGSNCCGTDAKACQPGEKGSVTVNENFKSTGKNTQIVFYDDKTDSYFGANITGYSTQLQLDDIRIPGVNIGVATSTVGRVRIRGMLGLGLNDTSFMQGGHFLDSLGVSQFGIYIPPPNKFNDKGHLSLGYYSDKKYGVVGSKLQWFSVLTTKMGTFREWVITTEMVISSFDSMGKHRFLFYTRDLTASAANAINGWFGGKFDTATNTTIVPCTGNPLIFTIINDETSEDVSYTIPYSALVNEVSNKRCISLVDDGDSNDRNTFGTPFFQAAYVGFDRGQKRIGFVPLDSKFSS
ncbi:acid protease [Rhizoclosmatium globosum]|uniref:Acid protease n=1 Tax=Rhizoclosmatium globosum TaxID=329046 RepID=A0A1Y2CCS4_9FUNG|nr:acid protease [Rhizoclosmatium globosum]|eukprot:ORY44851.1 acid protease [Rhizoclosmatium globosum]